MRHTAPFTTIALLIGLTAAVPAQSLVTVGPNDWPQDMSSDANLIVVVGPSDLAVLDVAAGTRTVLPPGGDNPVAISDSGLVMGEMPDPILGADTSGILVAGTWVSLGTFPGVTGGCPDVSNAYDLSDDGTVAVGLGWDGCTARAYKWTGATGMVQLPQIGPNATRANVVSADGQTIGGWDDSAVGNRRATVWYPDGTQDLVNVTPGNPNGIGEVHGLSDDGHWACGSGLNGQGPFIYSRATGPILLGTPPGGATGGTYAQDVSDNGKVVVGMEGNVFGSRAWIWTASEGAKFLDDYLNSLGVALPGNIAATFEISADGTKILGYWDSGSFTLKNAFIATIPPQPTWNKYGVGVSPVNIVDLDGGGSTGLGQVFAPVASGVPAPSFFVATGISLAGASLPLFGGIVLIDPSVVATVLDLHSGSGSVTHTIPIPPNPALLGAGIRMQSLCPDFTQPAGWALSNGLAVRL